MCVKFSITVCGVSSFMDSSAEICGWHMCENRTQNTVTDLDYREGINIKTAI
jgi:hypothetical protein